MAGVVVAGQVDGVGPEFVAERSEVTLEGLGDRDQLLLTKLEGVAVEQHRPRALEQRAELPDIGDLAPGVAEVEVGQDADRLLEIGGGGGHFWWRWHACPPGGCATTR